MDYNLKKRYELNDSQVLIYKDAYNVYAIEEYKIFHEYKKTPRSEKKELLVKANDSFCQKVRPLFKPELYKKWIGRKEYQFQERMKKRFKE